MLSAPVQSMRIDMKNTLLQHAKTIAYQVGKHIVQHRPTRVDKKGCKDLVSNLDEHAEQLIRDYLMEHTPEIPIFAEEMGGANDATTRWIVDPIDGTTNFVQGIPHFAVSIALEWDGEIVVAVTYDPSKDELFSAIKGGGAFLNDVPIRGSDECELEDAVLATGFPYDRAERAEELLDGIQPFLIQSRGIRRMGAATLDMAYVACGRLDGYWEIGLQPWDAAAGLLLIQEAGGVCTQLDGSPMSIQTPRVLSANSQSLWDSMFNDMGSYRT